MSKGRQALIRLILSIIPATITGKVKSVDDGDFTCVVTPSRGGPDYQDVRLKVAIDDNDAGVVCIPELNSEVVISCLFNDDHAWYITRFSKVKKWHLKTVSGADIDFDDQGNIKMNGGSFGGLVKVDELVTRINNIEAFVNEFAASYNAHTHVSPPAPVNPVTTAATVALVAGTLTPTVNTQIENPKVKHG